ncbi:MAG: leucine-rich repeat protein, partial [Treponema sp.]|nr:leucine-rich repeat protein [Treponema sp.]
ELKGTYTSTFNPKKSDKLPGSINFVTQNFGTSTNRWIFAGWYMLNDNGTEEKLESTPLDVNEDITLYAKWDLPYTYYSLMESNENDGQYYALDSGTNSYLEFNSIIESSEFEPFVAQIIAKHKEADEEKLGEGFIEVENGEYFSMNGILSVNKKYDRKAVKNTYICTADDEHTQTIEKEGKYGCEIDFSSDDMPVYPGFEFEKWQNKDGEDVESLPLLYDTVDSEFHAVYKDVRSTSSGNIIVNDGLLNLSIEQPDILYMNLASITLNAQTKLDGTDLSLSDDVEWSVQIRYGGVDINAYGTEYYELLQTEVEIDDGNGETGATTGTKTAVSLKNRLEIAGTYQLFVAATYENVTSSAIFNLNVQENEYYEHSVTESNISTVLTAEMKDLIAPAIVVLKGELPSDNETLYSGICSALNEASNMIDIDMSQVSGITSIGTGENYEFRSNNIQSLILPPSVETIGEKAFNSSGLKEITIPATVTEVASRNFSRCRSLEQFVISGEPAEGQVYVYSTAKDGGMLIQNVFNDSAELESCVLVAGAKAVVPATLDFSDSDLSVITQIGDYAFYENSKLESIESFGKVTKIGESAFYGCGALSSVAEVKAPITSIGYEAFASCYDLQSFCLGSDSITIGNADGNNSYSSVYTKELIFNFDIISIANENLGDTVNYDNVKNNIIPRIQGVESVVFKGKVQMPDLEYSTPPSSIPSDSFLYNYRNDLKSITFDDQNNGALSIIGDYQLNHYTKLETVNNSGKIGRIGKWALAYTKIAEINLDGIMSIDENAFGGCSDLAEFSIDEDSGSHYSVAMNNKALIYTTGDGGGSVNRLIRCLPASGITTLDFSSGELSGIKQIGAYAFDGCTSLTQITDWGGIEEIHDYAFNGCTELASIPALGNSSTESEMTLSENVFKGCSKLNEITIGGTNVSLNDTFKQSSTYSVIFDFAINSTNINDVRNDIIAGLYPYISKVTFNKTVNLPDVTYFEDESLFDDSGDMIAPPSSTQMKQSDALFARFADTATFGTVIFNGEGSTIGDYQFCSFENALGQTTYQYGEREVKLNRNVTTIGKYAFYGCAKLDAIDLTGVEVIYDHAFENTGLGGTTVEIPASVYAIGNCAFRNETQVDFDFENPITIEEEAGSFWENFYKFSNYSEWKSFVSEKPRSIGQSDSIELIWEEISPQEHSGVLDYIKQVIAPTSEPASVGYIISFTCVPHN